MGGTFSGSRRRQGGDVTVVIGLRDSGRSSALSRRIVADESTLVLVNTEGNKAHHEARPPGARVVMIKPPMRKGDLGIILRDAGGIQHLVIDDATMSASDPFLCDALRFATDGRLARLSVSVGHPLALPALDRSVSVLVLSRYYAGVDIGRIEILKSTNPFQFEANVASPGYTLRGAGPLNTADMHLPSDPSSQADTSKMPSTATCFRRPETSNVHTQTQSIGPMQCECDRVKYT